MSREVVLINPAPEQLARRLAEVAAGGDAAAWRAEVLALPAKSEGHAAWKVGGRGDAKLVWWTDPTGRRHYRLSPSSDFYREPYWGYAGREVAASPAFRVHPERLVYCQRPDGPPRLLALCGCGLVAYLHGLNWMGNCCGPCHDRYADDGFDVQSDDAPLPRLRLGQAGPVRALAVSADGALVASSDEGRIHLWDAEGGRARPEPHRDNGEVHALAFSPDGALLAAGRYQDDQVGQVEDVEIWSVESGQLLHAWSELSTVGDLGFLPGGRKLVVASATVVSFHDLSEEGLPLISHHDSCGAGHLAIPAAGWPMAAAGLYPEDAILVWRHEHAKRETLPVGDPQIDAVLLSPDGVRLIAANFPPLEAPGQEDATIRGFDTHRLGPPYFSMTGTYRAIALNPGKPCLLITADREGVLGVWDLPDPKADRRRLIATGGGFQTEPLLRLWGDSGRINRLAVPADGRLLVSGSEEGIVRLWPIRDILVALGAATA